MYNEVDSVPALYRRLDEVLEQEGLRFELIFVDDGSTDGTASALLEAADGDWAVQIIRFRRNFGKAAALMAGCAAAAGRVIVTMDADLQDDPEEVPRLVAALDEEGLDLVSGWKHPRRDPWTKTVPSLVFNTATRLLTGVRLHDFNSGFKAYRQEVLEEVHIYGELHRYIPVLAHAKGFRVGEVAVRHHPRANGRSKYGLARFSRGLLDLVTVLFLTRYKRRPGHLFGLVGLGLSGLGFLISLYMTGLWLAGQRPIGDRPLLLLGILLLIVGFQWVTFGLLAELITNTASGQRAEYVVRDIVYAGSMASVDEEPIAE
jgi:glycosyltransferase involved in cell wall biosynthesis